MKKSKLMRQRGVRRPKTGKGGRDMPRNLSDQMWNPN